MGRSVKCITCKGRMPRERREFLASTGRPMVCLACSGETPRMVLMDYAHKTAGYAVVVPRGAEQIAMRAYRRAR